MNKWNTRKELFTTIPLRSYAVFCLAVACTFAAVGVVTDLFDLEHSDTRHLLSKVLTTSGFAVLWVLVLHRRMPKLIAVLVIAQVVWLVASAHLLPSPHRILTPAEWRTNVALHGLLIMAFVLFSYGWFGTFFRIEGKRYIAAHTEIELASRIQRQLVPPVRMSTEQIEIYGVSVPSGSVGGDLVDAVESQGTICAYVADVAGHGVAAGVLMSMMKVAIRMHLMTKSPAGEGLLEAVNETLAPLTDSSSYATVAYVLVKPEMQLAYCVAAHPAVFHFQRRSGSITRRKVENFPLGMFPNIAYETATIDFEPGDILAIVTDGMIEVFDSKDRELGDAYIENALTQRADLPLAEIADAIFKHANGFAKATDDQSLLLVRRLEIEPGERSA